jgi:hypothetical protein
MEVDENNEQCLQPPPEDFFTPSVTTMLGSRYALVDFNSTESFLTLLRDLEGKKKDESVAINQLMTYCPMFT